MRETLRSLVPTTLFRKIHLKSFVIGAALAGTVVFFSGPKDAEAIDFGAMAQAASKLLKIKKNLDNDVKALAKDATVLFDDKDDLVTIKEQLLRLATETRTQIDSINKLVVEVEGHIKTTQADIAKTKKHVDEIDDVRKALD